MPPRKKKPKSRAECGRLGAAARWADSPGPMPQVAVKVSHETRDALDTIADAEGTDRSAVVRVAIEQYVSRHPVTKANQ